MPPSLFPCPPRGNRNNTCSGHVRSASDKVTATKPLLQETMRPRPADQGQGQAFSKRRYVPVVEPCPIVINSIRSDWTFVSSCFRRVAPAGTDVPKGTRL